jgi:hypothetical protein
MKLVKRLFTIVLVLLILLLATALAIPIVYKKEIVSLIKADINQNLNADVQFNEDIRITILSTFPNLSVTIEEIKITGLNQFRDDTLFQCQAIVSKIGLKKLYQNNELDLLYIELQNPDVQLITEGELNNWDVAKPSPTNTTDLQLSANFNKIIVQNGAFSYRDSATSTEVSLQEINGSFTGNYASDSFELMSLFECKDALISYEDIPYLHHVSITTDAITSVNLLTDSYNFKENLFRAGTIEIIASGGMQYIGDSLLMDIEYASNDTKFQDLLSLVPNYYKADLKDITTQGNASISGTVTGILSESQFPGYSFNMTLLQGVLQHKDMPESIKNVYLDLAVNNLDGRDESLTVHLKDFGFTIKDNPFSGKLYTSDIYRDPLINGQLKGNLILDQISPLLPQNLHTELAGLVNCDLAVNGRLSNIKSNDIQNINTIGSIVFKDVIYTNTTDYPNPIRIKKGQLNFTENMVRIPVMNLKAGKSDLLLSGEVDNLLGYALSNQTLTGKLTAISSLLDVGDFYTTSDVSTDSETTIDLPERMAIETVYNVEDFQYTNHKFKSVAGSAVLEDRNLNIKQLSTNCLDGQVVLSGQFNTTNPDAPLADFNLIVQNLNIQKAFTDFKTLRKLAPIAERVKGKFSSTIKLKTELLKDFSPNLSSITCQGILDLFDCNIEGLNILSSLGNKLDMTEFKAPLILKDLLLSFSIKDGKIEVSPFEIPIGASTLNLAGYSKLDYSINFDGLLSVPKSLYENNHAGLDSYIPVQQLSRLDSVQWSDLQFGVIVVGTYGKPSVKIDYRSTKKRVVDNVKNQVKSRIDDERYLLKKQAETELDEAKKRAEAAKKVAEDKAKAAIEEQKKRVEEQIQKEKEAANKKVQDELKKKRDELLKNKFPIPPK